MDESLNKPITFRPTEYDVKILSQIAERNPQLSTPSDLLRVALRTYDVESNDENSKGKRLQRIEERLDRLEVKMELILKIVAGLTKGELQQQT